MCHDFKYPTCGKSAMKLPFPASPLVMNRSSKSLAAGRVQTGDPGVKTESCRLSPCSIILAAAWYSGPSRSMPGMVLPRNFPPEPRPAEMDGCPARTRAVPAAVDRRNCR